VNRPLAAIALVSLFGSLVAACSAAPSAERVSKGTDLGITTQADSVSAGCPPFNVVVQKLGTVCTNPDSDDIHRKKQCGPGLVDTCTVATAPAVSSASGDGGARTPQSCTDLGGTPVAPPPELSTCTAGYQWPANPGYVAAFLCPMSVVAQAQTGTLTWDSDSHLGNVAVALAPDNGCLGAPLDPTSWGYVEVDTFLEPVCVYVPGKGTWCGNTGNCGPPCVIDLGTMTPSLIDP
jgi:hypothetical protein